MDTDLAVLFTNCLPNTLDTTVYYTPAGSPFNKPDTFVLTGDIPAMWQRDSTNQVMPYLRYVLQEPRLQNMFRGLINRQAANVLKDPYANAYNRDLVRFSFVFGGFLLMFGCAVDLGAEV